jgi:hypothetical protein
MFEKINRGEEMPLNLDKVLDELGRVPVIGPASDRELFLDLPTGGLAMGGLPTPRNDGCQHPVEREFLTNDFSH